MPPPYYTAVQQQDTAGRFADLLDGFTNGVLARGYTPGSLGQRRLGAIHLGAWCRRRHVAPAKFDEGVLERFVRHLPRCSCPVRRSVGAHQRRTDALAAREMLEYLRSLGVAAPAKPVALPPLVDGFVSSLRSRELSEQTVRTYVPQVVGLLQALGQDPSRYRPRDLRRFISQISRPQLSVATIKLRIRNGAEARASETGYQTGAKGKPERPKRRRR
jgi:hypothetical protein